MRRIIVGFIVTFALALLWAPLAAAAQPAGKVYRIGLLEDSPYWEVFYQGLRDLGYIDGQNIIIERRFAEGKLDRLAEAATELVRLPVDIITFHRI
jgi:hypothetical protein